MGSRVTKSTKEEVYTVKEGEVSQENVENKEFIKKMIIEKRDKKYFLAEPEELFEERFMILSFFAFGDFKESISPSYMNSLVRVLKSR